MPLLEEEKKLPRRTLLLVGVPSFVIALVLSLLIHQWAHVLVFRHACGSEGVQFIKAMNLNGAHTECPMSSLAGTASTFVLALTCFALYMRFPHNLFLGSMAFVNAILRLPEAVTVFFQLLVNRKANLNVDESAALALLRFSDPAAATVLICFFSLTIFFLAVTIIHDTRMIQRKWLIALCLFAAMIPLENLLWRAIVLVVG